MRFEMHLPSAFVGGAIVAVSTALPHLSTAFFSYDDVLPIPYIAGGLVLAVLVGTTVAAFFMHETSDLGLVPALDDDTGKTASNILADGNRPSATPLDWLSIIYPEWRNLTLTELTSVARTAFANQVTRQPHPVVIAGLGAALRYMTETKIDKGWALREIGSRMEDSEKTGKTFDLSAFIVACNAKVPSIHLDAASYSQAPYPLMGLLAMLKRARIETGVVASAEFLWVKRLDRGSWYALNNLGRSSSHVEAAGVMSHFFHTLSRQEGSSTFVDPQVDAAVDGLTIYLRTHGLLPSETIEAQ